MSLCWFNFNWSSIAQHQDCRSRRRQCRRRFGSVSGSTTLSFSGLRMPTNRIIGGQWSEPLRCLLRSRVCSEWSQLASTLSGTWSRLPPTPRTIQLRPELSGSDTRALKSMTCSGRSWRRPRWSWWKRRPNASQPRTMRNGRKVLLTRWSSASGPFSSWIPVLIFS